MRTLIMIAATAFAAASSAEAASYRLGQIEVTRPWSRPAAAGMTGAGYFALTNRGKAADTLVAVESKAARKVEIHASSTAGGVMRMQRLDKGLPVPPGATVTLAPGGYHLMLIGLSKATRTGDKLPATLIFASGARLQIELAVGQGAPAGDGAHRH